MAVDLWRMSDSEGVQRVRWKSGLGLRLELRKGRCRLNIGAEQLFVLISMRMKMIMDISSCIAIMYVIEDKCVCANLCSIHVARTVVYAQRLSYPFRIHALYIYTYVHVCVYNILKVIKRNQGYT